MSLTQTTVCIIGPLFRWGTQEGLAHICLGPKDNTVLDPSKLRYILKYQKDLRVLKSLSRYEEKGLSF